MAMQVQVAHIGVDVSKAELAISVDGAPVETIANEPRAIRHWLDGLVGAACFAVEATNDFHMALACAVHRRGHGVYVVNG